MTRRLLQNSLLCTILVSWVAGCAPEPWQSKLQLLDESSRARLTRAISSVPRIDIVQGGTSSLIMLAPGVALTARHCLSDSFFQSTTVRDDFGNSVVIEPGQSATLIRVIFTLVPDKGGPVAQITQVCWATVIATSEHFDDSMLEAQDPYQLLGPYQANDWAVIALTSVYDHELAALGKHATRYDMETPLRPDDAYVTMGWKGGMTVSFIEAQYEDITWPSDGKDENKPGGAHPSMHQSEAALFKTRNVGTLQGMSGGPLFRVDAASGTDAEPPAPVVVGVNVYGRFWTPWALLLFKKPYWSQVAVARPDLEPVEVYQSSARNFAAQLARFPRVKSSQEDSGTVLGIYNESGWLSTPDDDTSKAASVRILVDTNDDDHADLLTTPEKVRHNGPENEPTD
ncbi:MAG: hypothetical protein P8J45_11025 [Phycisphaerales bacterium]|nr:hypothetical protein [Phycisphaerales bacterium]